MIDFSKLRELAEMAGEELGEGEWYRTDDYRLADRPMVYADAEFSAAASPDTVLDLLDRIKATEEDAARYRWLREQHWNESEIAVVRHPKKSVKLGSDCPSGKRLDEIVDAARSVSNEKEGS